VRRELERIEIPGEHDARGRAWDLVSSAFAEREPTPPERHRLRLAVVIAVVAAVLAAGLSSPGRAVLDEIREAVGVERAQPGLFSLPAEGRLLVSSGAGAWIVQQDGSKRLLGDYREASWSPFGRFVAAARSNELAALAPDGDVRWTIARPQVSFPRWGGSEVDTRIAYLAGGLPRVVAGDGTGDEPLCDASSRRVAPAWRPGAGFVAALVTPSGAVRAFDLDGCRNLWRSDPIPEARRIEWSSDASRVLVIADGRVRVLNGRTGATLADLRATDGAFRPGTREPALIRLRRDGTSEVLLGGVTLFSGLGQLDGLTWSPDGRWLLVGWPAADQLVFVRADGGSIRAVANVSDQFRSRTFPRVEGWCCGD
jgi:hypothetical protein